MTIQQMLNERHGNGVPLWGSNGFPYRCGVTEQDFTLWAFAGGEMNPTLKSVTVGALLRRFCEDCPYSVRRKAEERDACIAPVLEDFRGVAGGRPPEGPIRDDYQRGSTVPELCTRYNVSARTIYRILEGLPRSGERPRQRKREAVA